MTVWSRRELLLGAAALAMLTACARTPGRSDFVDHVAALEDQHDAYIGLFAVDLDSGATLSNRDNDPFAVCSTFKTYAAARVLQMVVGGEVSLDERMAVESAPLLPNSPVTEQHAGASMTLAELCAAALQHSDNTAGNMLLQTIGGPPAVTRFARSIGDTATRLDRWETALNSAIPGDLRDTSTPRALGGGYRELLTGTALPKEQRAQLESWMRGNVTSAKSMRAGLPSDWTTADKTGAGDYGSTNAVGIAFGPEGQRLLLSIMTRSRSDDPKAANLQPLIAEVVAQSLPNLR